MNGGGCGCGVGGGGGYGLRGKCAAAGASWAGSVGLGGWVPVGGGAPRAAGWMWRRCSAPMLRVGLALAGGFCRLLRLGGAASRRLAKKGGEGQSGVGEDDERREVRVGDGGVGA